MSKRVYSEGECTTTDDEQTEQEVVPLPLPPAQQRRRRSSPCARGAYRPPLPAGAPPPRVAPPLPESTPPPRLPAMRANARANKKHCPQAKATVAHDNAIDFMDENSIDSMLEDLSGGVSNSRASNTIKSRPSIEVIQIEDGDDDHTGDADVVEVIDLLEGSDQDKAKDDKLVDGDDGGGAEGGDDDGGGDGEDVGDEDISNGVEGDTEGGEEGGDGGEEDGGDVGEGDCEGGEGDEGDGGEGGRGGDTSEDSDTAITTPHLKQKVILIDKHNDPFSILPEDWCVVSHDSGMPVYLHKVLRCCTLSKPYFLGKGSARKHDIPVTSIPCMAYRRALDIENNAGEPIANTTSPTTASQSNADIGDSVDAETLTGGDEISRGANNPGINGGANHPGTNGAARHPGTNGGANHPGTYGVDPGINGVCPFSRGGLVEENKGCDQSENAIMGAEDEAGTESSTGRQLAIPSGTVKTLADSITSKSIDPIELRDYCKNLFQFKTIEFNHFNSWTERRKFSVKQKKKIISQLPKLPDHTKLITCKIPKLNENGEILHTGKSKEFVLNPTGKSDVCILHEYVQHALKVQPTYEFKELNESATPYSATVTINNIRYGTGYAANKRMAKNEAATLTLEILIPDIVKSRKSKCKQNNQDMQFFNDIGILDPRVSELCLKAGQMGPYTLLAECLKINFGLGDTRIQSEMKLLKAHRNEFIMSVGKHSVKIICKNKRDGKQLASQAMLQKLHPHITCWGSLLKLYANKQEVEDMSTATELSKMQPINKMKRPNYKVLNKLKSEMIKLQGNFNISANTNNKNRISLHNNVRVNL